MLPVAIVAMVDGFTGHAKNHLAYKTSQLVLTVIGCGNHFLVVGSFVGVFFQNAFIGYQGKGKNINAAVTCYQYLGNGTHADSIYSTNLQHAQLGHCFEIWTPKHGIDAFVECSRSIFSQVVVDIASHDSPTFFIAIVQGKKSTTKTTIIR